MNRTLLTTTLFAAAAGSAQAAIDVSDVGFTYSQNFDSLTTSTTAVAWANDSTLAGWSLFISTLADAPTIVAGNGGSNAGTFYSFGSTGSGERAFGSTASGGAYFGSPGTNAVAGYMAVAFTNSTGAALDGFTLGYSGEQWRNGGNANVQSLVLEYGIGTAFGTVAAWTAPGAGWDMASVVNSTTAAAVDGNAAGLVAGLGGSATGLAWAPGQTLWIRWSDRNDSGNDHGLGIDDLSFAVSAVPEPGALALMLAGLATVGFIARRRA
jgi:PEP-CTERM motif